MSQAHPLTRRLAVALVTPALLAGSTVALLAQQPSFPNTRKLGRAAVQYQDDDLKAVAAYYHSQRQHDAPWILIETAVTTRSDRIVITREDVSLVAPDGTSLALPPQSRFREDFQTTRLLVRNASAVSHGVGTYFSDRPIVESINFFTLPGGDIIQNEFAVDSDRVVIGDLFFESPTGRWDAGTYTLVIAHPGTGARAALPIELE